jgi:uncharacterized protein
MTVVDLWVNALSAKRARAFGARAENTGIAELFGTDLSVGSPLEALLATMGEVGVDVGVAAGGLASSGLDALLADAASTGGRLLVAAVADRVADPVGQVARLREVAGHGSLGLVRVTPLVEQYPLNHRLYYPLYAACCELGLPVAINVGIPGPRVRSACQHPELLEDVLIDFPGLVVIGSHMGHPYEALLIQYMLKWPNLYLSNSAYSAKYFDPALATFMGSSRGRGRVLFASDHPFFPMDRALEAARQLDLDQASMDAFLGASALRLLQRRD